MTSGEVREAEYSKQWSADAAEYLESAENLRIFRGRYIVGTLTNNANIIILYYLVPYRLSTDSKNVTLNDLESPFCVKFCFVPVCVWSSDAWLSNLGYS